MANVWLYYVVSADGAAGAANVWFILTVERGMQRERDLFCENVPNMNKNCYDQLCRSAGHKFWRTKYGKV